jgi:hypothetical protein
VVDVGVGYAGILGLQPIKRACGLGPAEERRSGLRPVGVGVVALGEVARAAVRAVPAPYGRRDDHPVALLEVPHLRACLLDYAHALVA